MKLVSYFKKDEIRSGLFFRGRVFDIARNGKNLSLKMPASLLELLKAPQGMQNALKIQAAIAAGETDISDADARLAAPLSNPPSCRDAYAFRRHVATARQNRGLPMIAEFDAFPVFYFTNHHAVFGPGEIVVEADHLQRLDFELEAAVVIVKKGKNIPAQEADKYIAGYMIMNDFSARFLQMEEMKLNLGPAKGKDFATATGPWLVTPDELEPFKISTEFGNKYDLAMRAFHNGKQISPAAT